MSKRLIDADALAQHVEKWTAEAESLDGAGVAIVASTLKQVCDLIAATPTVSPVCSCQKWRNPETDPPKVETEVLILYRTESGWYEITTAHHENGNVFSEDSEWNWEDLSDWGTYDEERDDYRIPEGWWEYRHFNPDDVYNNRVDCPVVGWMPLPKPPKEVTHEQPL